VTNLAPLNLEGVFSPPECASIISGAEGALFNDGALLRGVKDDNTRRARVTWLEDRPDNDWIGERLINTVIDANRHHFHFNLSNFSERYQIAWYSGRDGGFFDWHADLGDGVIAARRKLTLVVQLSAADSYDGGALDVNIAGHVRSAPRAAGSGLMFPSFLLHRVTPTTRGERYSLTTWIHGPAFR